jgi:hypothetical protein
MTTFSVCRKNWSALPNSFSSRHRVRVALSPHGHGLWDLHVNGHDLGYELGVPRSGTWAPGRAWMTGPVPRAIATVAPK